MSIDRYEALGFDEEYYGFVKHLGGTFGFAIQVTLTDWEGEPLDDSEITVRLPHQCDAWEIVRGVVDQAEALERLQTFITEAQAAHTMLARLGQED